MKNMQAVVMPQIIFDDISVRSEEYHSDYFIAAPSFDEGSASFGAPLMYKESYGQNIAQMTYGNLDRVNYTYDSVDRLTKKTYSDSDAEVQYYYNSNGEMYKVKDGLASRSTLFEYDLAGRIVGISVTSLNGSEQYAHIGTRYEDGTGNVKSQSATMFNSDGTVAKSLTYNYTYCGAKSGYDPAALARYSFDGVLYTYEYDRLGRLVTRKSSIASTESGPLSQQINGGKKEIYTYVTADPVGGVAKTTTLVKSYRDISGLLHTYTYDKNGNISFEVIGEGSATQYKSYLYDSQNRLTRYNDSALDITVVYEYDARGNILSATTYDYYAYSNTIHTSAESTKTYGYTNNVLKDAVTTINGETITYDSCYNPLKWTDGRTLTWVQGRRLESVTGSAGTVSYVYDENGIRVAKSSTDGRSTQYYVADGTYLGERTVIDGTEYLITYLYGDSGVVGIEVNGTRYFFVKNLQGDVTGIIDSTGAVVANYAYDAYGFCYSVTDATGNTITSPTHIANLNPFRYRSYMYDTETEFYYVSSRYYDPAVGRWLNADSILDTSNIMGVNLFAYCNDNPLMFVDPLGLCAKAWAAGYQGPCPGQGLPGCMDNWPQFRDEPTLVAPIDPNSPPDHPDYIPPKKGGGKKVKNPNGPGKGWEAKDGGVWIPSPNMHGGEGWTIQYPGGRHSHAYPGGGVRNHFESEQSIGSSIIMIFVGALATGYLVANDITGVGAADDPLLSGSMACFSVGINGIFGKKVCTECGEVKYGY